MKVRWTTFCGVTFRKFDSGQTFMGLFTGVCSAESASIWEATNPGMPFSYNRHTSLCWLTVAPQKTPQWLFCPLGSLLPLLTALLFTPGQDKWGPHLFSRLVIYIVSGNLLTDLQGSNSLAKICMREKLSVPCTLSIFDLWHLKLLYVIGYPSSSRLEHSTWGPWLGSASRFSLELAFTVSVAETVTSWKGNP